MTIMSQKTAVVRPWGRPTDEVQSDGDLTAPVRQQTNLPIPTSPMRQSTDDTESHRRPLRTYPVEPRTEPVRLVYRHNALVGKIVRTKLSDANMLADDPSPDVAMVTHQEMDEIMRTEEVEAFLVDQRAS